ncbi:Rep family protein, partial [Lactobacillus amylolyticus]
DTNPDGEIKKKHWYIAMFFNSKKSYQQMSEITQSANVTMVKYLNFNIIN